MKIKKTLFHTVLFVVLLNISLKSSVENFEEFLPKSTEFTLENGIKVFYIKDELPQLHVVVSVGFGTLYEKKNTAGLSELLAASLSLGGSRKYPGGKLHESVESLGGKISVGSSWEATVISMKVLSRFREEALDILADLLSSPNLNTGDINSARLLQIEKIRRKSDSPDETAIEKAREIIFDGEGYGSVPTAEKVGSFSDILVRETWEKYFVSGNILVGVSSGDDLPLIRKGLSEKLSVIRKGNRVRYDADRDALQKRMREKSSKIFFLPKNIPQSTIVLGTVAPEIDRQSQYPLSLMNYILGEGSFNSRLMNEIRVKKGLAYTVMSTIRFRSRTGVFLAFAQTRNDQAGSVFSTMQSCISGMSDREVTDDELTLAKNFISNSFIFRFDTRDDLLGNYIFTEYNVLPGSYFHDYLRHVNGVSKADIMRESRALFRDGLVRVVVGHASVVSQLKEFGDVVILEQK